MSAKDESAITVRLPKDLKEKIENLAKREERSINKQLTLIIRKALEESDN